MDVSKIYIDMDGVLADFDAGLRDILHMEPMPQDNQPMEFQEKMWAGIRDNEHFYFALPPMQGAVETFKGLYEKYGDKVEILTGVPKPRRGCIYAGEDKVAWVKKYLSDTVKVNLVLRADKIKFCTGRDCFLIDDYLINTEEWEQAGGTAITFTSWDAVSSFFLN